MNTTAHTAADSDFDCVRAILCEQFELEPDQVSEASLLSDDLDIDSIDAVDLLVRLKAVTGKDVPAERFKEVRSVGDVVAVLRAL